MIMISPLCLTLGPTSSGSNPGSGSRVEGSHARIILSSPPVYRTPFPPMAMHWTFSPP